MGDDVESKERDIRPQFGNRYLTDPQNVFEHNAWDNVIWDADQEEAARNITKAQFGQAASQEDCEKYEELASQNWDQFYGQHQNRFFKDRNWLFTEFPELYSNNLSNVNYHHVCSKDLTSQSNPAGEVVTNSCTNETRNNIGGKCCIVKHSSLSSDVMRSEDISDFKFNNSGLAGTVTEKAKDSEYGTNSSIVEKDNLSKICGTCKERMIPLDAVNETGENKSCETDGSVCVARDVSRFCILEVGCGVGNTVFPLLQTNNDPNLMVYCCDFSPKAIQIVKDHPAYDQKRCHAFVFDVTDSTAILPFPPASLDIIILIFVLSAISPDKVQGVIDRLSSLLKPGGKILLRDYGRYDMAQLRFKKGRCLGENFYVRGDGTRVYFFTQEEVDSMFKKAGLLEEQNLVDRRLQVNRGRQLKMYRVWVQCKYLKPFIQETS